MNGTSLMPRDFQRALKQGRLHGFFLECAYVHRAGYLSWILDSAYPEVRQRRIVQAVERLRVQQAEVLAAARGVRLAEIHRPVALSAGDVRYSDQRQSA